MIHKLVVVHMYCHCVTVFKLTGIGRPSLITLSTGLYRLILANVILATLSACGSMTSVAFVARQLTRIKWKCDERASERRCSVGGP